MKYTICTEQWYIQVSASEIPEHISDLCFSLLISGTNDESLDVSSHLGWKNATTSYYETKTFMDR